MKTKITEKIPKGAGFPTFDVKLTGLTQGEVLSLFNALGLWSEFSAVAGDVFHSIKTQMETIPTFKEDIDYGPPIASDIFKVVVGK